MPAYGYSPSLKGYKGVAQWVPRLNALLESDPEAWQAIERRANEIWSGYEPDELYSKSMEGGTGERWERDPMSRAFFKAFSEYEQQQADNIMPELRPYDDPQVEAAIQQIMQESGVDRRTAIQMYKRLAQEPGGRQVDPRLGGGMLSVIGQAAKPSISQPIQPQYGGDKKEELGLISPEYEGIDSPVAEDVAQPDQPDLAPGDERAVDGYNMAGPQIGGGQEVYGEPVTERSGMDTGLGILRALATAGGAYFGGRDVAASDKRQAQGVAQANLINALAGNMVAQAPRETPRAGKMTSIMKGLASGADQFVKQREAQRALDQQAILTKLTKTKLDSPSHAEETTDKGIFKAFGESLGRKWKEGRDTEEFYSNPEAILNPNLLKSLKQKSPAIQRALISSLSEGFEKGQKEARTTRQNKNKTRINNRQKQFEKFVEESAQYGFLSGERRPLEDILEEWEKKTNDPITVEEREAALAAYEAGKVAGQIQTTSKGLGPSQLIRVIRESGKSNWRTNDTFSEMLAKNPGLVTDLEQVRGGGGLATYQLAYNSAQFEAQEEEREGFSLDAWAKKEIANINAGIAQIQQKEKLFFKQSLSGPIFGHIPIHQFWAVDEAVWESTRKGWTVELASLINGGRPSDKDAEAVANLIPERSDRKVTAEALFQNLTDMLVAKREAIVDQFGNEQEFHVPVWDYTKSGEFDLKGWKAAQKRGIVSESAIRGMVEQINTEFLKNQSDPSVVKIRQQYINTIRNTLGEGFNNNFTENEDGTVVWSGKGGIEQASETEGQSIGNFYSAAADSTGG